MKYPWAVWVHKIPYLGVHLNYLSIWKIVWTVRGRAMNQWTKIMANRMSSLVMLSRWIHPLVYYKSMGTMWWLTQYIFLLQMKYIPPHKITQFSHCFFVSTFVDTGTSKFNSTQFYITTLLHIFPSLIPTTLLLLYNSK